MTPGDQQQVELLGLGEPGGILTLTAFVAYSCHVEGVELYGSDSRIKEIQINGRYLLCSRIGWWLSPVLISGSRIEVMIEVGDRNPIQLVINLRAVPPETGVPFREAAQRARAALAPLREEALRMREKQERVRKEQMEQEVLRLREQQEVPGPAPITKENFLERLRAKRSPDLPQVEFAKWPSPPAAPAEIPPPPPPPQPTRFSELDIEDDE